MKPGTFVTIRRTFRHNDRITLILPMKLRLTHWPRGGIAIERGPLVYSLRIEEDWHIDPDEKRCTKAFPAWNIYPASPWNYALDMNARSLQRDVEVVEKPMRGDPWSIETAPIELRVPARRVRRWGIVHKRRVTRERAENWQILYEQIDGEFRFTPQLPDPASLPRRLARRVETVTLVPYGCTHLRLTIFPHAR